MPKDGTQIDLRRVLPDELADALSNDELGQYTRLMLRLLSQPDHALPTDVAVLSRWAGSVSLSSRVLAEFTSVDGRLRCARVDRVLGEDEARRRLLSDAGKRGAAKLWSGTGGTRPLATPSTTDRPEVKGGHGHPIARPWPPHSQAIETPISTPPAGSVRASHAPAALQRRDSNSNSLRSSAGTSGEMPTRSEIAGAIHDGLEAAAQARLSEYRRAQATTILERAIARWLDEKRIQPRKPGMPLPKPRNEAMKISAYPQATPAACEIAVIWCDTEHADPDEGPVGNPIAFVIGVLGAHRGGKPFEHRLHEQPIVNKWDAAERRVFDSARIMAAADAAARRIDDARAALLTNPTPQARIGASSPPPRASGESA